MKQNTQMPFVQTHVSTARLGGGGMFDQCGNYMSLLQDLVEEACLNRWLLYVTALNNARLGGGGMFDQGGYYMSLLQTWRRRHV